MHPTRYRACTINLVTETPLPEGGGVSLYSIKVLHSPADISYDIIVAGVSVQPGLIGV